MPGNTQKILTEIWHHFWLKNDGEKWSRKNYFEIPRWPSEIPANLSGTRNLQCLMPTSKRIWPHYERLRSRVAIGDQKDSLDYHQQCLATTFRRGSKESSSSCFAPWGSILDLRSWRQASQQWVGVPKCLENWVERKCLAKFRKSYFGIFIFGVWLQASQELGVFSKF